MIKTLYENNILLSENNTFIERNENRMLYYTLNEKKIGSINLGNMLFRQ